MSLDHSTVKRLAFIRYLYQSGVSQSRAVSPLSCASILTFHDAVELFLQLASEHLNSGGGQPSFMDYWDILNKKLDPNDLGQKESMRRLNKARVGLKHHGTFPSDLDTEAFRAAVTAFFQENTPVVFGIELDDVSLVEYVNPESARVHLHEAEELIRNGDTLGALDKIAVAFSEMISDYEDRKCDRFSNSPFYFGRDMTFLSSSHMGLRDGFSAPERKLAEFVDRVKESLEAMQDAMKVLALGMDYRKYSKFKRLTPNVIRTIDGAAHLRRRYDEEDKPSPEEARFCLDFVVESSLALGEFDYSVTAESRHA
ncbi:MAG: hypothetical protein ABII12_15405 [Planctomycetota bacterium]